LIVTRLDLVGVRGFVAGARARAIHAMLHRILDRGGKLVRRQHPEAGADEAAVASDDARPR
jgi:hypothetical protein